ncbi:antibiotic biosynthesis monooxygenase family protein [Weizmannia acidilactici]|nr:antibiotic biosynthesis monooxygenase [Weizmannia acidilactici]GER65793.1 heme-degrading monooxygenase HmoB [Weizmannia acidilactici]
MNIYITTGTYDYLLKIKEKYPNEKMVLMQNPEHALLVHETEGKTVFTTPRHYKLAATAGDLGDGIFFIFTHLPIPDEGKPVYEFNFKKNTPVIEHKPGFAAFRLLRPVKGDTYIAVTGWKDEDSFGRWKRSIDYLLVHSLDLTDIGTNKSTYNAPAFTKEYVVPQDKEAS